MAFIFTLLFVVTAYITPEVLFGSLAQYRVEVVLALLAVIASLPNIIETSFGKSPQTYAFLAFCVAVPFSILAGGWVSGAAAVLYGFLPVVLCFVLPAANFRTRQHLQWMTLAMLLCSSYFIYNGLQDLQHHVIPSNFLYGDGELRRLRGLGFVFDPNDLSQVLVSLLPMVFLWKSRNRFFNIFLLGIPIALLVTGMYFTHSRGAAVALMATIVIALRRKIGTAPAVIMAGSLFAASLAVGWSGGRDVSVEAGGDRLDAWSTGLQFIKSHPLFGVGAGRFADFNEITAHNSVVVCAAEIGLPGFVCWVFMIFAAMRAGIAVSTAGLTGADAAPEPALADAGQRVRFGNHGGFAGFRQQQATPAGKAPALLRSFMPARSLYPAAPTASVPGIGRPGTLQLPTVSPEHQADIRRMARLLICSLTGFLVAGWFLSRALSMWLFFYFGCMYAVTRMAAAAGLEVRQDSFGFLLRWSVIIAIILLLLVYGVLKFRALTGG